MTATSRHFLFVNASINADAHAGNSSQSSFVRKPGAGSSVGGDASSAVGDARTRQSIAAQAAANTKKKPMP